ncbi:MAG: hypothetical protein AB8B69_17305 [Chitinophagales bacterium]
MQQRKIIQVLKSFSTKELKSLEKFVESPYFNENQYIISLFAFLKKYAPKFSSPQLTTENAFFYVFPRDPYKEQTITKLLSKLYKIIEAFIAHEKYGKQAILQKINTMDYHNNRLLFKFFPSQLKEALKLQSKVKYQDNTYFYNQYLIEGQNSFFQSIHDERIADVNFQNKNDYLDIHFLISKLMLFCLMLNRQRSVNIEYDFTMMEDLLHFLEKNPYQDNPIIALWHKGLLLLRTPNNVDIYQDLKKLLEQYGDLQRLEETRILYTFLENASKEVIKTSKAYYEDLFQLYDKQLKMGLFYTDGYLLPAIFKNISTIALRLEKYDWAENFMEENRQRLLPEARTDLYNYCRADMFFHQENYDAVLDLLYQVEYRDIYTKLGVKRMQLKVYYETEEWNLLDSSINAFRVFIHRQKDIADSHKKSHQNFINMLGRIIRLLPSEKDKIAKLQEEVKASSTLSERDWLRDKLEGI